MFGGITQLLAGLIQLRTGNTFAGVLFSGFGAFWLSLFAIAEFFLKAIPANQVGHALGLFLYAFGFFVISMTIASFRTNAIVVTALLLLIGAFFTLGAGNYGAHTGLVHIGGYLGLGAAALALYLSCAETVRGELRPRHSPGLAAQPLSARAASHHSGGSRRVTFRGGPGE